MTPVVHDNYMQTPPITPNSALSPIIHSLGAGRTVGTLADIPRSCSWASTSELNLSSSPSSSLSSCLLSVCRHSDASSTLASPNVSAAGIFLWFP